MLLMHRLFAFVLKVALTGQISSYFVDHLRALALAV